MASVWLTTRTTTSGAKRYRVEFRQGGREAPTRYAGSFRTKREATIRQNWIAGELAALRVPDLRLAGESTATVRQLAERWLAARVDVSAGTLETYRVALGRILPQLGDKSVDRLDAQTVADLVADLHAAGLKKQTIRKTVSVLAMLLDHGRVTPNPARDKLTVKLPREERRELRPPTAEHVEAVVRLLPTRYRLPLFVLDATGMRIGELEALAWGDVDEPRQRWRVSGAVAKTGRARWVPRSRPSSCGPSRGLWRATIASPSGPSSTASAATASARQSHGPAPPPACRRSRRTICATGASRCSTWAGCRGRGLASRSVMTISSRRCAPTPTFSPTSASSTTRNCSFRARKRSRSAYPGATSAVETCRLAGVFESRMRLS